MEQNRNLWKQSQNTQEFSIWENWDLKFGKKCLATQKIVVRQMVNNKKSCQTYSL